LIAAFKGNSPKRIAGALLTTVRILHSKVPVTCKT
jgi:hypothetical protein